MVVSTVMHSVFPGIQRSALKQMCEKERLSEGESHTCDCLFHVCKNFYGLGAGP